MTDKEDGGQPSVHNFFKEIEKRVAVGVIEPLGRFVEDEQPRALYQRPAYEHQPLFGKSQPSKRYVTLILERKPLQPLSRFPNLRIMDFGVKPDGVVQSGEDDMKGGSNHSVVSV